MSGLNAAVEVLFDMDDEAFADVVSEEVRSQLPEDDQDLADALRHDDILDRWYEALTTLHMSIDGQFAARKGQKDGETRRWRSAARKVQAHALGRKQECRALIAERNRRDHAVGGSKHRLTSPPTQPPKPDKEARRAAGERAVRRLKDAHSAEFMCLLAEEFTAAGLEIPDHWTGTKVYG